MPKLSPIRAGVPTLPLKLVSRGKVRDTYLLPANRLLVVTTDGVSIFDFVLNALVEQKGAVLNAMNYFWLKRLEDLGVRTHLLAAGLGIDRYLPPELRGAPALYQTAMVVKKLSMYPVEFVARGYLTGSGLAEYKKSGTVCGHYPPLGLQDGDSLPWVLDTPTTKAAEGHDTALEAGAVRGEYPEATVTLLKVFQIISSYARSRGIIFADTKLELGEDETGNMVLGDEVGTPDSSRYWSLSEWENSRKPDFGRKAPASLDKQMVRDWGKEVHINDLDPSNPDHVAKVHGIEVPELLLMDATRTYRYIFWRLTGQTLEVFAKSSMGFEAPPPPKRKAAVIFGSRSDLEDRLLMSHIVAASGGFSQIEAHIISCHRNPDGLRNFAEDDCGGADVVICAGGKAFALPGVLSALIRADGSDIPVIGVALGDERSRSFEAAKLSISELPGQPVVMDEETGAPYCGHEGFKRALERAATGEFLPAGPKPIKPAEMSFWSSKM